MLKYNTTIIIIIAVFFGLASGIVGSLVARVYLFEKLLNIPMFGDINLSENPLNRPSVVITGARNVVVEQDVKVQDTMKAVNDSLVGIFDKKPVVKESATSTGAITPDNLYKLSDAAGSGFVITSDGWIVSSFIPESILSRDVEKRSASGTDPVLAKYVVIANNDKVYTIDRMVFDPVSYACFYHVKANDLPVKNFSKLENIKNGQMVVAYNWEKQGWLTTILGSEPIKRTKVDSSDDYQYIYVLEQESPAVFDGAFLFALDNSLAALIDQKGRAIPVDNFLSCLNCLLDNGALNRPVLGVNFVDLAHYLLVGGTEDAYGALITRDDSGVALVKNSPADRAGLLAGDIILSVDNIPLKDGISLNHEISKKLPNREITLSVKRKTDIKEYKIILGKK